MYSYNQFNSNLMFVTSLDEALIRTNNRNSDMVYFHQNENVIYRVKVDEYGQKTWAEFVYSLPTTEEPISEIDDLKRRVSELEKLMEVQHGKSDE